MTKNQPLITSYMDWTKLMPNPPLLTSFQANWSSIHLAHYRHPNLNFPEISNSQHILLIPLGHHKIDFDFAADGRLRTVSYSEKDYHRGYIEIYPADLPVSLNSHSTVRDMELIQCYLEPNSLAQTAYESINPDRVELSLALKKVDLLITQICLALKASLEVDCTGSGFYADSMTTALSAHLLRHYTTRKHTFREYDDGLSKQKLKQAFEYIQAHLGENISLSEVANELGMSQYYFCRLFKQSTGVSPHRYLIRQRVEQAKHLLKKPELSITWIALECGFANQSHFAKCFRQHTGMNPNQFRKL
ncbi:AraC family transcriptional regulator [filamentous cyanobacterium CCP5]|nr:AraC family transcriptional regulator [filamentous cyanobacterium CCP5]PSN14877.1 AraC family transcriptional regulator [filamentous cyanobacterium CCT1]PSN78600.1 AraC family transcriptional regulator [filamentous cyanobacterium CCP4]